MALLRIVARLAGRAVGVVYERIQAAFHANRERLKAERLAREAEAAARKHKNLITAHSPNVHGGLRHR
ncbi:hypothetical protein [Bradyrhizobium arachidis]|uniref:hypothetical protein n=1 Tax=Bradyrhizobium TaxID=374 RepID=UPI0038D0050B